MTPPTKTRADRPVDGRVDPASADPAAVPPGNPVTEEAPIVPPREGGWIRRGPHESTRDYDRRWHAEVFQGAVPQFTWRAAITGTVLGSLLGVSNLYLGLKVGWTLGITITAIVLSTTLWRGIGWLGGSRMSLLEQNCMQSTAAAAGNNSAAVMITAVPAVLMATGQRIDAVTLVAWTFCVSMLGMALAIPLKRHMVDHANLPWPSAVAAAETLRTLHAKGEAAVAQARWLAGGAFVAALVRWSISNAFGWWRLPAWPEQVLVGGAAGRYGIGIDASAFYYAAGALLGRRVTASMLVGSAAVWAVFAPWLVASGRLSEPGYRDVMFAGAMWFGAGLMVASGLTGLALQAGVLARGWRSSARAARDQGDPTKAVQIPVAWGLGGIALTGVGIVALGHTVLGIPWFLGLLGVTMAALLAGVAVHATGETDITPAGPLGKITQLGFGVAAPQVTTVNLFGASIVAASGTTAADTARNLRCGHLLGADPKQQILAQAFGVFAGACVVVAAFQVLVPDPSVLGTTAMPAPAAVAWRALAEVAATGFGALDGLARVTLAIGLGLGALLAVLESRWERRPAWWPSAFGLGIGAVIGFAQTTAFFVGAVAADLARRRLRSLASDGSEAGDRIVALASGGIAGDSLMGVLLALLLALGWMAA